MAAFADWLRQLPEVGTEAVRPLRLLVFNCTHERDPAAHSAPPRALEVAAPGLRFDAVCFTPNAAGLADAGADQTDTSVRADPALTEQHRMLVAWHAASAAGAAQVPARVVPMPFVPNRYAR